MVTNLPVFDPHLLAAAKLRRGIIDGAIAIARDHDDYAIAQRGRRCKWGDPCQCGWQVMRNAGTAWPFKVLQAQETTP